MSATSTPPGAAGDTNGAASRRGGALFNVELGHHEEPQIATHLLASIPHGTYLETFHPDRDPLFYELVANRTPFEKGWYAVPQGPGFGLALDAGVIAKYRVDGKH